MGGLWEWAVNLGEEFVDDALEIVEDVVDITGEVTDTILDPIFDEGPGDDGLIGGTLGSAGGQFDDVIFDNAGTVVDVTGEVIGIGINTVGSTVGGVIDTSLDLVDAAGQVIQGDFEGAWDDLEDAGGELYETGEDIVSSVGEVADTLLEGGEEIFEDWRDYTIHTLLGYPTDTEIAAAMAGSKTIIKKSQQAGGGSPIGGGGVGVPIYSKEAIEEVTSIPTEESKARRRISGVQDKFGSMRAPILDDTTEKRPE
jgi:hypothetical protein